MAEQVVSRPAVAAQPLVRWRWQLLGVLAVLAVIGAFGNAWDLYWHIMVGRDSFWIPPHTMMYTAVASGGAIAAAVVLATTLTPSSTERMTTIWRFRAPLGYFVLGLGALQMVISAPFDDWWHRTYGLDVTVWSPPHLVGFSGATVMLAGVTIEALAARRNSLPLREHQERWFFWLLALLFALTVRWVTFLNSTSLGLSWVLEPDRYSIAGPWAPWWGLWASLFLGWTFVASARCLPERRTSLPIYIVLIALLLRLLEFVIAALGFSFVLPWGTQTLHEPFRMFFDYDLGLWVTTVVLIPPVLMIAAFARQRGAWHATRFGLVTGALFGLLLAVQFIVLRPVFGLVPIGIGTQLQVLGVSVAAGTMGGLIGAKQGDWLAHFSR